MLKKQRISVEQIVAVLRRKVRDGSVVPPFGLAFPARGGVLDSTVGGTFDGYAAASTAFRGIQHRAEIDWQW